MESRRSSHKNGTDRSRSPSQSNRTPATRPYCVQFKNIDGNDDECDDHNDKVEPDTYHYESGGTT